MKTSKRKIRKVLDSKYSILSLKELLDRILAEGEDFPLELKNSLTNTRDMAWKIFVNENEKTNSSSEFTKLSE